MTGETYPWVFGSGTGVPESFFGINLSMFAERGYRSLRQLVPESQLHMMPLAGLGRMNATYLKIEAKLLELADGGGRLNLVGHSQPASHYLLFAARHPEKVCSVVSVAGAHFGSRLADHWLLKRAPCSKDLSPQGLFMPMVRREFALMRRKVPEDQQPRVISVAVYRDSVVLPWHSSLVPGAENYVLAHRQPRPKELIRKSRWIPTEHELNHFNIIWDREAHQVMKRIVLEGPKAVLRSPQRTGSRSMSYYHTRRRRAA